MKHTAWIGVLVAVAMVLAACGGDSSTETDGAANQTDDDTGSHSDAVVASPPDRDEAAPPDVDAPDSLGPFDVGHTSFEAVDAGRDGRAIPIDVWYPVDPGTAGEAVATNLPLGPGIGLESEVAVEDPPVSQRSDQPLVVFSHGYQGINTQSVDLMEVLASHGFVVASPEHVGTARGRPTTRSTRPPPTVSPTCRS